MNDLLDIKRIIDNYLVKSGQLLENATKITAAKDAEVLLSEGLRKLDTLKLSQEDRGGIKLLRESFKSTREATKALQKGKHEKAQLLIEQAADYGQRYNALRINRAVRRLG